MTIHMFLCTVYNQYVIHNFIMVYSQLYDRIDRLMFHSLGCSDFFNFSELKLKKRFLHLNKALCEYMRKYQNIYFPHVLIVM